MLLDIYRALYKYVLCGRLWILPPRCAHSIIYRATHGNKKLNWTKPTLYDEKIHWLMVNRLFSSYSVYADKYLVRNYVAECGYENLLVPLLGVWKRAEDINFDELSYPCIFKTNNGSGNKCYYKMIQDTEEERNAVVMKMKEALEEKRYKRGCEYHYKYIEPLVICESLLVDGNKPLTDYKLVCSNGKVCAVLVCQNRDKGRDYYTPDWIHTDYVIKGEQSGFTIPKPKGLNKMIEAAEQLSKPFELARVDFYDIDGKVYFGEITLTPAAGNNTYLSEEGQKILGGFIEVEGRL